MPGSINITAIVITMMETMLSQKPARIMSEIFSANSLSEDEIISVIFSQTKDIRSRNAAAACRRGGFCASAPLFCVQEADTEGSLPLAVRVLITVDRNEKNPVMVYLRGASILRPEWKR